MNLKELKAGDTVQLQGGLLKKVSKIHEKGLYFYVTLGDSEFPDIYHATGEFLSPLDSHPLSIIKIVHQLRPNAYECEGGGFIIDPMFSQYNTCCLKEKEKEAFTFQEML